MNHVHGIGRAVDGDEGAGDVAILVVGIGEQMPGEITEEDKAASFTFWQRYGTPLLNALLNANAYEPRPQKKSVSGP